MVQSFKNSKINYKESNRLNESDKKHHSALYVIDIFNSPFVIALGQRQDEYKSENIYFYAIYLISPKKKIKAKIGVFEIESQILSTVLDDEGDVNIDKLDEPLLFSYITPEYLEKYGSHGFEEEKEKEVEKEVQNTSDNDIFTAAISSDKASDKGKDSSKDSTKDLTFDTVFKKEEKDIIVLPEETKEDAAKGREAYVLDEKDDWIVQYMKNKQYHIEYNEGGGDCLFACIRDAYKEMGYQTTVAKLRTFLSQKATKELFENYKKLYDDVFAEQEMAEKLMEDKKKPVLSQDEILCLRQQYDAIQFKMKKLTSKNDSALLMEQAKKIQAQFSEIKEFKRQEEELKNSKKNTEALMNDFGFMKKVHNLDDLRTVIQTSSFWADTWAISTLELILNMKLIILEKSTDPDAVMKCGQKNDDEASYRKYHPRDYIMVQFSGNNHYELISYKKKHVFTFPEIPFDVKMLVVNRCLERTEGVYAHIPEWTGFMNKLGVVVEETETETDVDADATVVFAYHPTSNDLKPGKGVGETIPLSEMSNYQNFEENWRRKLDDHWDKSAFTVDNLRWSSVALYLLAFPFKEVDTSVYKGLSEMNFEDASSAIKPKGAHGKMFKALKKVSPETLSSKRTEALRAKFTQNADLTTLLVKTKNARLTQYVRSKPAIVDVELMAIRKEVMNS